MDTPRLSAGTIARIVSLTILSLSVLAIVPVNAPTPEQRTAYLPCDFSDQRIEAWISNGSLPYLSDQNDEVNKIWVNGIYFEEGDFWFQNFVPYGQLESIDDVDLRFQSKFVAGGGSYFSVTIREENSVGTIIVNTLQVTWTSYENRTYDIYAFGYDTISEINAFDIVFQTAGHSAGSPELHITYAELIVLYTLTPPPSSWADLYFGFAYFMVGVGIMMFSPIWLIKKIQKKGVSEEVVERALWAFILFCIGFALTISWLWS